MTRNISGKAKVNSAAGGLRQNAFCSYFTWCASRAGGLIGRHAAASLVPRG